MKGLAMLTVVVINALVQQEGLNGVVAFTVIG